MQAVVWQAYNTLGNLLWDLGVRELEEKAVPPLQMVEFLGTGFNLIRQILFIPQRNYSLMEELQEWVHKEFMTCTQLESIVSKLQAVNNCIQPSHVFVARIFNKIAKIDQGQLYLVDTETRKDLK